MLTALCRRSKASWGYPPDLLERWADDLRIEPADIVRDIVLVAASDAGVITGFARVSERDDHTQLKDLWVEPVCHGPRRRTGALGRRDGGRPDAAVR